MCTSVRRSVLRDRRGEDLNGSDLSGIGLLTPCVPVMMSASRMAPSDPVEDQQSFVMSSGAQCGDYWDERLRGFVSLFVLFSFLWDLIFDLPVKASGCTKREEKMNMGD